MTKDLPLTEKEVKIYQTIYYDHYKPLIKQGLEEDEIKDMLLPVLEYHGWTWRIFEEYKSIDFMQRLVFEYSHDLLNSGHRTEPMTSTEEYRQYDPNFGALRLKDNSRSDDPDRLN